MIPTINQPFASNMDQVVFSIDEQQAGLIISLLRNNIYKNPLLASIRESLSNSLDEHNKFNVEKSVDITLPNYFNSNLIIRDWANGMSKDFMLNDYTKVGLSTKSSDNTSLGGIGIGRMSPLAYADLFTVVSITSELFEGEYTNVRREYVVSNDNNKVFVSFLLEEITQEGTGVTISYPIKKEDFTLVEQYVRETVEYVTTPITINKELVVPCKFDLAYKSFKAVNNKGRYSSKLLGLIGGLPNNLNFYDFNMLLNNVLEVNKYFNTISNNKTIVLDIPIGAVDQAADKSIQLSTRTKQFICSCINQVVEDHKEFVTNSLLEFNSITQVSKFLLENNLDNVPFTWKGKTLPNTDVWLKSVTTFRSNKKDNHLRQDNKTVYFDSSNKNNTFYYNDLSYEVPTKALKAQLNIDLTKVVIVNNIDNSFYNLTPLSSVITIAPPTSKTTRTRTISTTKKCYRLSRLEGLGRELNIDLNESYTYLSMDFYYKYVAKDPIFRGRLFDYFNCDLYITSHVDYVKDHWACGHNMLRGYLKDIDSNYLIYKSYEVYNVTFNKPSILASFITNNPNHIITKYLNEAIKFNRFYEGRHSKFIDNLIINNVIDVPEASFNLKDLLKDIYNLYPLFRQDIKSDYLERYIMLEDSFRGNNNGHSI